MIEKFFRILSILFVLIGLVFGAVNIITVLRSQVYVTNLTLTKKAEAPKRKFVPQFTQSNEGLQNIAYITMVKDEDDIIYENLVWHFAIGFRKFIIFDNNSTDDTSALIEKFTAETKDVATVLVVQDPFLKYNQGNIMTSGYRMAHEIWPEVKWFFPVDADEFWVFSQEPAKAIAMIPNNVDAVSAIRLMYRPYSDYDDYPSDSKFWHRLHYRDNRWDVSYGPNNRVVTPKMFLRYSDNFSIAMGNHNVVYHDIFSIKAGEESKALYHNIIEDVRYDAAELYGIHLREYHMRSPGQTHKKFTNGLKAASKVRGSNKMALKVGDHWIAYQQEYLDKAKTPEEAAAAKFKSYYSHEDDVIDDPLPLDEAIALYKKLINLL